jgi:chorismate dehydratase
MPRPIRVGAVNYLNTKPLIEGLASFAPHAELQLDLPSRLADRLAAGDLEVALIPVVEYIKKGVGSLFSGKPSPNANAGQKRLPTPFRYLIVPGVSIASRGPVLSVTLFSRVPWPEIRSVALDEGSRTSSALTRILLEKRYGIRPKTVQLPISVAADDMTTDAVLLIGDRAMKACLPGFAYAYDLGQEWYDWTGQPFVYAVWAVREGVDLRGVDRALRECRDHGLARVGQIAEREAAKLGLDAGFCRRYLSNILCFDLGPREIAGLRRFQELACELDLVPEGVELDFYDEPSAMSRQQSAKTKSDWLTADR